MIKETLYLIVLRSIEDNHTWFDVRHSAEDTAKAVAGHAHDVDAVIDRIISIDTDGAVKRYTVELSQGKLQLIEL